MLNLAVRVDVKPSVTCAVRLIDYPFLLLTTLKLDNSLTCDSDDDDGIASPKMSTNSGASKAGYEPSYAPKGYKSESIVAKGNEDFSDLSNPASPCVLLKAVLVVLGVVARPEGKGSSDQSSDCSEKIKLKGKEWDIENKEGTQSANAVTEESFEQRLQRSCAMSASAFTSTSFSSISTPTSSSRNDSSSQVKCQGKGHGLEIVCCSELPAGSGKLSPSTRCNTYENKSSHSSSLRS